ncbi:MAG: ElyC/SanA/YdcF family protein [Crocinitomicaceae bacterium]
MKSNRFTFLRKRKWWLKATFIGSAAVLALLLLANYRVEVVSDAYIKNDLNELPDVKVGVVPGTIKYLNNGNINQYFQHRIDAAVALYNSGKVKYLLISGDNSSKEYNEPLDMRNSLTEKGVPKEAIILDYAGFDTYDSMIRAREVFGQKKFIVVSQEFQNERAVYIARRFGIKAYGYNAKAVTYAGGFKTKFREFFARGKAYLEVNLGVAPTFLGEKIVIE